MKEFKIAGTFSNTGKTQDFKVNAETLQEAMDKVVNYIFGNFPESEHTDYLLVPYGSCDLAGV